MMDTLVVMAARKRLNTDIYDMLVDAYREKPGDHTHAARRISADPRTCKKLWMFGIPSFTWAKPIKEVLWNEAQEARAERARVAAEVSERRVEVTDKAREDAIKVRAHEAQLVGNARGNAIAIQVVIARIMSGLLPITSALKEELASAALKMSVQEKLRLIHSITSTMRMGGAVMEQVIAAERALVGSPTEHAIGTPSVGAGEMSRDEALGEIDGALRAMKRAHEAGWTVHQGGRDQRKTTQGALIEDAPAAAAPDTGTNDA